MVYPVGRVIPSTRYSNLAKDLSFYYVNNVEKEAGILKIPKDPFICMRSLDSKPGPLDCKSNMFAR